MRLSFAILAALILASAPASAADDPPWEETDKLPAVQNRKFRMEHEFAAGAGVLPIDPYTKGLAVTGGYTWHINETWAAEAHFSWIFNFAASLRDKLENNFGEPESKFRRTKFFGQAGALFKPLYGKLAFLNDSQIYWEFYVSTYIAFGQLYGGRKTELEPAGRGDRWAIGPAPGFGFRGFLTRYLSLRFDFNWIVFFSGSFLAPGGSPFEVVAPLKLSLNLSFTTRSDLW